MRIISGFHDYYDRAAFSMGNWPVYLRTTVEKKASLSRGGYNIDHWADFKKEFSRFPSKKSRKFRFFFSNSGDEYHFKLPDHGVFRVGARFFPYREYLVRRSDDKNNPDWLIKDKHYSYVPDDRYDDRFFFEDIAQFLIVQPEDRDVPIIHYDYNLKVYNPRLEPYEFWRAMPHSEIAMELDRFVSNLATPEVQPKPISDEVRIESHGFDKKTSFRKPKQK